MQPKSSDLRNSHFVPKAYLKKFTKKNGKLFLIKKNAKKPAKPREVHPSGICYQPGFYEFSSKYPIKGQIVVEPNYLEERGFLYENRLNKWIDRLISPTQLVLMQDAYDLATTLLDLKVRNPYYREHSFSDRNIGATIDNVLANEKQKWETSQSITQQRGIPWELINRVAESIRQDWTSGRDIAKELHNRTLLENLHNPSQIRKEIYNRLAAGRLRWSS